MAVNTNNKLLKERILLLTYIYRTLPVKFLYVIAENDEEKKHIRWIINNSLKQGYLISEASKLEDEFIRLTLKGYKYVVQELLNDPKKPFYQYKTSRSLLKPVYIHSFLNFAFMWNFHKKNRSKFTSQIQVYEDSDINNCKISFSYKGKTLLISPDVMILTPMRGGKKKKAIFVENDTGRETYKMIYHKIIEYAALAEEGMEKNNIDMIDLYFIFLSERRLKQLFTHPKGFLRFFDLYNKTGRGVEVRMRYLLQTLKNAKLNIYLSSYNFEKQENPYVFRKYDLAALLIKKEATWNNFL